MERGSSSRRSRRATDDAAPTGGRRPYHECPICKHGFTTAQALGGHMNIHRRDRATRRPGRDAPANGTAPAAYTEYPPAPAIGGSSSSFATYYSGPAYAAADTTNYGSTSASLTELNLFGAAATYDHADLSLGVGPRASEEWERPDGDAERNLDLELRLGRRPGWGWH